MMHRRKVQQEDLFGGSPEQEIQKRIKELDAEIASAMKKHDYEKAKLLTTEQEKLLKKAVSMDDNADGRE